MSQGNNFASPAKPKGSKTSIAERESAGSKGYAQASSMLDRKHRGVGAQPAVKLSKAFVDALRKRGAQGGKGDPNYATRYPDRQHSSDHAPRKRLGDTYLNQATRPMGAKKPKQQTEQEMSEFRRASARSNTNPRGGVKPKGQEDNRQYARMNAPAVKSDIVLFAIKKS